jgi:hypothetical protein
VVLARGLLARGLAGSDDAGFVCEYDGLYPVAEAEFVEHSGDVCLDRGGGEDEPVCDFRVG